MMALATEVAREGELPPVQVGGDVLGVIPRVTRERFLGAVAEQAAE